MIHKETNPFYKSKVWRQARTAALVRDHYLCVRCLQLNDATKRRRPRPAVLVHHIKPLEQYPELALELDNLESLCADCHNVLHPEKGAAREREQPTGVLIIKI